MSNGYPSGRSEYDLKIAILDTAMELATKHPASGENPRTEDRRFVLSTIRLLKRAFDISEETAAATGAFDLAAGAPPAPATPLAPGHGKD